MKRRRSSLSRLSSLPLPLPAAVRETGKLFALNLLRSVAIAATPAPKKSQAASQAATGTALAVAAAVGAVLCC